MKTFQASIFGAAALAIAFTAQAQDYRAQAISMMKRDFHAKGIAHMDRLDEDALQLVKLYAERGSPKYEKAALRWLERYLTEGSPRLQYFADVTASLASRESQDR